MESTKCPVCGKPGIPNYHNNDVICPQCKSDLSIYRVIDKIPEEKTGFNIWKPISAVALVATAVCGFFLFQNISDITTESVEDKKVGTTIFQLRDSIATLQTTLKKTENRSVPFPYIVRKGDSFWSISQKMYGVGSKARIIAEDNNKTIHSPIYIGDTIFIYHQHGTNTMD